MPIHYDIETDELYLEGIEKGILQKSEENVSSLLKKQQFTVTEIADMLNVTEEFVRYIAENLRLKVIH